MMEKFLSRWKEDNQKKQIENIVIFIILLIIVIIVINTMFQEEKNGEDEIKEQIITNKIESNDELEEKLKRILSSMNGVGSVEVMISYANTVMQTPMMNTKENTTITEEQDVNGGKRETKEISNEQSVIFEEKNNMKQPAIRQTIMPEIVGVIVVAEGANHQVIKENIKNAVGAVINIASHRIQVFAK